MDFGRTRRWKSHYITRSADFLNPNQATDFAEEAFRDSDHEPVVLSVVAP
jgi:hypothetical protein